MFVIMTLQTIVHKIVLVNGVDHYYLMNVAFVVVMEYLMAIVIVLVVF